jgi:hypothetical protein
MGLQCIFVLRTGRNICVIVSIVLSDLVFVADLSCWRVRYIKAT